MASFNRWKYATMERFQREKRILKMSRLDVVFNTNYFSIHVCDFDLDRIQWTNHNYEGQEQEQLSKMSWWLLLPTSTIVIVEIGVGVVVQQ